MKISKLFHWLYAILMLLPFLVFLPNAFYYGFNEHAVAQEKTEQVSVYYETNEVNTLDDLVVGNIYSFSLSSTQNVTHNVTINCQYLQQYSGEFTEYAYTPSQPIPYFNVPISTQYCRYFGDDFVGYALKPWSVIFVLDEVIQLNENDIIFIKAYNGKILKESQTNTYNMSITDSMSYAWDSVWQNDLFSWSYGSFLTEPFIYIGNVFNVPEDNALYYALSYWLDISIIWLCFDMVMYIPLLVHRWLDKGIIE